MSDSHHGESLMQAAAHLIHRYFLWFLVGSYVIAGLAPGVGLSIKNQTFGTVNLFGESTTITLPTVLLGFLLFNAGLGTQIAGYAASARIGRFSLWDWSPIWSYRLLLFSASRPGWRLARDPDEVQNILVGLALVASMPIAGSSTAWSQNANGDLADSAWGSCWDRRSSVRGRRLSPCMPSDSCTTGDTLRILHELASTGTGVFLFLCVLLPSLGASVFAD